MDWDLREHAKNKDVKGGIIGAVIVSLSIVIAFYWKDLVQEIIERYFPQSLYAKILFGIGLTIGGIYAAYYLMKLDGAKDAG